jgi:PKD repeat protein
VYREDSAVGALPTSLCDDAGEECLPVPTGLELTVRSPTGRSATIIPTSAAPGVSCAAGGCEPFGDVVLETTPTTVTGFIGVVFRRGSRRAGPGSAFTVDVDAGASEGGIHTHVWRVDQDGAGGWTPMWTTTTTDAITSVDLDEGDYRACVRVLAGMDLLDEVCTEFTLENQAPVAAFTIDPNPASVDEEVTFDASTSTDDSAIVDYAWDFQDDATDDANGSDPVANFTYTSADTYTVRLKITDDDGVTAETTLPLEVEESGDPTLTIAFAGTGEGSVTSDPAGISCSTAGGTCAATFPASTFIALTPNAYAGSTFDWMTGWAGCNDADASHCYVILDASRTVTITINTL